jgi:disulfide bond formation protein DsbB
MTNRARRVLITWQPLLAALAAGALLGIAHAFEKLGGLAPCALCLKQREVYWAALALGLVGFMASRVLPGRRTLRIVAALLMLVFLWQVGLASYHAGVEWKWWPGPQSCSGHAVAKAEDLTALLNGAPIKGPSCEKAAWRMLGLSMAGWNALAALMLAGLSAFALITREPVKESPAEASSEPG